MIVFSFQFCSSLILKCVCVCVCVKHFSPLSTGDLDECRTLLRNGANIDRPGPTGMTPVMIAITQGHIKVRETKI